MNHLDAVKKVRGIYKVTNKVNGKVYIGQSVDIGRRWREHMTAKDGIYFHKAIQKYGVENFEWEVIEQCKKDLDEREIYWIEYYDSFNKGYNCTKGGDSGPVLRGEDNPNWKGGISSDPEYSKKLYEANKEQKKEYCKKQYKQWYEINKDKIKEYKEANKEKRKEYNKQYYEENKEKMREKVKEYREANKEKIKQQHKQYYQAHKEELKVKVKQQQKEYYVTNKEKRKEKMKEYYEVNKEKRKEYREAHKEKAKEYYEAHKEELKEKRKQRNT